MIQDERPPAPAPLRAPAAAPRSDPQNLAIGALVCALGGIFCFVTSIPAIVLGHMARAQGKATAERRGVAMATVALVIAYAYVGVVVVATGASIAFIPTIMKRANEEMRIVEEQATKAEEQAEAEEAKRNAPAPVERGPLPARVRAELPFNNAALAKERERYRPLAYAREQVCRGEGDARERFITAVEGSRTVDDDGLRAEYGRWIPGCGTAEPCEWLRKRARETRGALRTELQRQISECPAPRSDAQPDFSWTMKDPFGSPNPAPEQLLGCATDKGKPAGDRYHCLQRLARSDRARASTLAAGLLADGTIAKLDLAAAKDPSAATLYAQAKALADYPTLDGLERRLQGLGLLPAGARPATTVPPVTVEELLEAHGRHASFDVETGMFPNQHDVLAAQLWRLTGLPAVAFEEIPPADRDGKDEGDYQLHAFTHQDQYSVIAKNHGDWYDLDAVLRLLDRMASDANSELRSEVLPTEDQFVTVIMAPPAAIAAARQLGLLFTQPVATAETRGKAFEAEVLRRIGHAAP